MPFIAKEKWDRRKDKKKTIKLKNNKPHYEMKIGDSIIRKTFVSIKGIR